MLILFYINNRKYHKKGTDLSVQLFINSIIKRSMKRMVNTTTLKDVQIYRLAQHTQQLINSHFDKTITNKINLLEGSVDYITYPSLGENITKQTFDKGLFPRVSYARGSIQAALNNAKVSTRSSKVKIENIMEKADVRWITEKITADRFGESSEFIQEIVMKSEKPNKSSVTAIIAKAQTGQMMADTKITLNIDNNKIDLLRDIKAGNNAKEPFSGVLAEIPYINNDEMYFIINESFDLKRLQNSRQITIEAITTSREDLKDLREKFRAINNLQITEIDKNRIIQELLFQQISRHEVLLKASFYYHFKVREFTTLNSEFFDKLKPHINNNIFDNKKSYNEFMKTAIKVYCDTVQDISRNIQNSKSFWMGTGFEEIADDLF